MRGGVGSRWSLVTIVVVRLSALTAPVIRRKEWASELEKNTRKREDRKETFGTAPRAFHPERGGNAGGPLISQAHSALVRG